MKQIKPVSERVETLQKEKLFVSELLLVGFRLRGADCHLHYHVHRESA